VGSLTNFSTHLLAVFDGEGKRGVNNGMCETGVEAIVGDGKGTEEEKEGDG